MALLQYLGRRERTIVLRDGMINQFPYYAMVNRIVKQKLDPFLVETPVETIHDVLKHPYKGQTYEQLCLERAEWFRRQPQKKFIMWSGGIDSTLVVISFLKTHSTKELENVHILCSSESIDEFPEFWNDIVRVFKGRIHSSHSHIEIYLKQGLVVSGEFGDQTMGSDVITTIASMYGEDSIFVPYKFVMPHLYTDLYGPNKIIEMYEPLTSYSLYPIVTAYDWCWWFNFTNKWNMVKYRLLQKAGWTDAKTNFKNMYHFFETLDFQIWTMNNPDKKIGKTLESYKWMPKQLIIDYTGYENYRKKPKIGSLGKIWSVKAMNHGVDTDFNFLTKEQAMEYINK